MDAQQEKDEKKIIKISVRNLVEFILRCLSSERFPKEPKKSSA